MRHIPNLAIAPAILLVMASVAAQRVIWSRTSFSRESLLYAYTATLGDLDRDGVTDLVTSSMTDTYGEIHLLSGRDGRAMRTWRTPAPPAAYPVGPAGDLDRDGTPDVLAFRSASAIEPPDHGLVVAYSSATGRELWRVWGQEEEAMFGWSACSLGDVDRDGVPDVAVGSPDAGKLRQPRPDWLGEVHLLSGATGQILRVVTPASPDYRLGWTVGSVGDVDRDGVADVVASSPGTSLLPNPPPWYVLHLEGSAGMASLISGATGQRLWQVRGLAPEDQFGWTLTGGLDLDRDGVPDVVAAAGQMSPSFTEPPRTGYFLAISGRTGATLATRRGGQVFDYYGHRPALAGDLDGDGLEDFFVGAPGSNDPIRFAGLIEALSGRDLATIWTWRGDSAGTVWFGNHFHTVGDVDGDDIPDFLNRDSLPYRITIYSGAPPGVDVLGRACAPAGEPAPRIGVTGAATRGRPWRVNLSRVPAGRAALLLLGASNVSWNGVPLPLDLTPAGFAGCSLLVAPDVIVATTTALPGVASSVLTIPGDVSLLGTTVHLQWSVVGTQGVDVQLSMSRALRCVVQ